MTDEELINELYFIKNWKCNGDSKMHNVIREAIKALESRMWIPVSDPLNELPKDRWLYVTTKVGCVETLVYDMTEWSDADIARSTVAYMDYYEPQPYKEE